MGIRDSFVHPFSVYVTYTCILTKKVNFSPVILSTNITVIGYSFDFEERLVRLMCVSEHIKSFRSVKVEAKLVLVQGFVPFKKKTNMDPILYAVIGTPDMTRANAFAKIKIIKEVLRSVKEILWPTDGREANVVDAVKLAVFGMARSDVFNAFHNVTRRPDGAESTCNIMALSADATKSDNVEGKDVEKNDDERVIPNLVSIQKSVLHSMGILGIDSNGEIAVGTTSGTVSGFVPNNGACDVYINTAIPIGHGPPIKRFNLREKAIILAREENISLPDAIEEAGNILSEVLDGTSFAVVLDETGKLEFYTKVGRPIWARANGTSFTYSIDNKVFTEEF